MSVEHQLVNADELIGHMHGARNSGLFAAERNRIGECARISSAADCKGFLIFARPVGIDLQKFAHKLAVGRDIMAVLLLFMRADGVELRKCRLEF